MFHPACPRSDPAWVVGYVVWSRDMERVALLSKDSIVIASKKLILQRTLNETKRVKSGAWDDKNGVFIYTTLDHIKFWLPNGMSGIIESLDVPVYVTKIIGNKVFCLDRDVQISIIKIVPAGYFFDLSLLDDRMTRNDLKDQLYNTNIMVVHGEGDGPGTMDISGTWCVLYFGYSSSPVGPERLQTMHAAVERISEVIIPFFVTVDPHRDTPLRLRAHLGNLASTVQGVTGDGSRDVAQAFGVNFERVEGEGNDYFIETPHKMYLVNPKVEIVRCFEINTDSDELSLEIAKELAFARMVSL